VPDGQTQFQFEAGDLKFRSSSYEWLVVAGQKAQYKGSGTVNGVAGFDFILTATDEGEPGAGRDKFRIKIWNSGGVIYDNQHLQGGSDPGDNADPTTALGGGNIQIHR
jgi:hypothetical protein